MRIVLGALVASVLACSPALADGAILKIITKADSARLAGFDKTRAEALAAARSKGARSDVATLDKVVEAPARSFEGFDMTGNWQCRTIKAGGPAPLVVYGWFKCRVSDEGSGWFLEKISGSQRTQGRFYTESDTRNIYLGSFYIAGDKAPRYGAGPKSDQVGYAIRSGDRAFRIEFPSPTYESKFDILEFRR